jgi:predicted phage tail protein
VPNAPTNLSGAASSPTQINLQWTDNSGNEQGFSIERCTGNNCTNFAQIAQTGPNVTTFANTGLTGNTWYRYRVRAFNASGNSAFSNTINVKTPKR